MSFLAVSTNVILQNRYSRTVGFYCLLVNRNVSFKKQINNYIYPQKKNKNFDINIKIR